MKRLYLVRHAKSDWGQPGLADRDRPLNGRGKRDAPVMGQRLKHRQVCPAIIIASPAKRALKTATLIAAEIGYPNNAIVVNEALYAQGAAAILNVMRGVDDAHAGLMLCGHNPDFTELAEQLSGEEVENIPTCGVFAIDFDVDAWHDVTAGVRVFFDYPKKHPHSEP